MQLKKDTDVVTTDGEKIGSLDRVAIDPLTKDITHLIVNVTVVQPEAESPILQKNSHF